MAPHLKAEVPFEHLVNIARRLGSQDCYVCPHPDHDCWRKRGLEPFIVPNNADNECPNCWMRYFVYGD